MYVVFSGYDRASREEPSLPPVNGDGTGAPCARAGAKTRLEGTDLRGLDPGRVGVGELQTNAIRNTTHERE